MSDVGMWRKDNEFMSLYQRAVLSIEILQLASHHSLGFPDVIVCCYLEEFTEVIAAVILLEVSVNGSNIAICKNDSKGAVKS